MECLLGVSATRVLSLWTLLFGTFNFAGLKPSLSGVRGESADAVKVSAVSGRDASLSCDTRSPQPSDTLLLVVWYKNDVPIYSYDSRVKGPSAHWSDDSLGGRARWFSATPSALRLQEVTPGDRAVYRCRVDFKVSPTRNARIALDVIELPEKPKIFDEKDKEVIGIAGPYIEDSSLKLTCVVSGGKPMPRLRWWRDDKVIATLAPLDDGSRLSLLELRIPKLTRDFLEAGYTCTADNTALVQPLRADVQLQIYLRPLLVEILSREQPLSVGQETELSCRATGARPPAIITWWLNGKQIPNTASQKNSADNNETVSSLLWTPRMEHNGHTLTCRASHIKLEHTTLETSIPLNLHYVPIVKLQLGAKLNPNDIEEGDDVYFDCVVRANPPAYKVVWEHNDQLMTHNQRAGVIAGSAHLALQSVSKQQSGRYRCTASNVEGDGSSQPVNLHVMYKPLCLNPVPAIVGAALNDAVKVVCEVDSFPAPKNFQWTLNNSAGTVELDQAKITDDGNGRSIFSFTPTSDADYGSLACRATNLAGQQIEPCRYTLLPGLRPEPPSNCTSFNLTDNTVELQCLPGYDGGLQTTYNVEIWEMGVSVGNISSSVPHWKLKGLGKGKALQLVFYAFNALERSQNITMTLHTLSWLALHTEAKTAHLGMDASWALGILAGTLGTLTAVGIVAFLAKRRHRRPLLYEAPTQSVKASKGSIQNANHSPIQPDDKNPDVVPLGKEYNCTRGIDRPPEPPPYGSVVSPPVGSSRSNHSLQQEVRSNTPHTPNTPASDAQSIGTLPEDRRSVTSGTLSRRREVVTTRTPLLANARESCV